MVCHHSLKPLPGASRRGRSGARTRLRREALLRLRAASVGPSEPLNPTSMNAARRARIEATPGCATSASARSAMGCVVISWTGCRRGICWRPSDARRSPRLVYLPSRSSRHARWGSATVRRFRSKRTRRDARGKATSRRSRPSRAATWSRRHTPRARRETSPARTLTSRSPRRVLVGCRPVERPHAGTRRLHHLDGPHDDETVGYLRHAGLTARVCFDVDAPPRGVERSCAPAGCGGAGSSTHDVCRDQKATTPSST